MIERALARTREVIAGSKSPAILSSFGKDSMLLLWLVREVYTGNVPVIWFRTGLDEHFGWRMIREWDLTVYRWHPSDVYLLEQDGKRTLVHEYGFGGDRLPMLVDLDGRDGPCAARKFPFRTPTVYTPFDTLLVGWKDSDTHWVKGDAPLARDGFQLGNSQVFAPLRHMTDEGVRAAIVERRIPYEPTPDELPACTHCVSTMPLAEFRSRYNLKENTNGPDIRG